MASVAAAKPNTIQGQIDQLEKDFKAVRASAVAFETQEGRARSLLESALENVFGFSDGIFALGPKSSATVFAEFFAAKKTAYNAPTRANPYIGLVKLTFPNASASSRSQYATVLNYARATKVKPADFKAWLKQEGIEGWRDKALDAQQTRQRQINTQARTARLQRAESDLKALPASSPVSLPTGVVAPEGFAIVLARIDGSNNASIIQIVDTDSKAVDPVLIKLTEPKAATSTSEVLAPLFRAVDLILNTTPDNPGAPRDILIRNTDNHGTPTALVQAVSEAYSFPGALMDIEGHIPGLPADQDFILSAVNARDLLKQLDNHQNWSIDQNGAITADGLTNPVTLTPLPTPNKYRAVDLVRNPNKAIAITLNEFEAVASYIDFERAANVKWNKGRPEKRPFPASVTMEANGSTLDVRLSTSAQAKTFGITSASPDLEDRLVAVSELEALAKTFKFYEKDADGWLLDSDIEDAGIVIEAWFENDRFCVVVPTRSGESYNQVCKPL